MLGMFLRFSFTLAHIALDLFFFLGSAEAYIKWDGKLNKLCQKYLYQKLLKSDNWFLSYSRKCWGYFFETQCR